MAKQFNSLKKGLGPLDIIQIGKYKGCRVDSIIEQDDDYLRYMQSQKILVFDSSVLQSLMDKFSTDSIKLSVPKHMKYYPDSFDQINGFQQDAATGCWDDSWDDDIPF